MICYRDNFNIFIIENNKKNTKFLIKSKTIDKIFFWKKKPHMKRPMPWILFKKKFRFFPFMYELMFF